MATSKSSPKTIRPDEVMLTKISAARLSRLTGVSAEKLAGRNVTDLRKDLEWVIDPNLLLFRRVCGRVVKHDPVSGEDWGVPGATVHVYDTDFNLFGYFPGGWPYGWFWPFFFRREEIATAVTDQCGYFCVWIPRFDIDWILRWRRERICFPEMFVKPNLRDLLERLRHVVEIPPHIGPDPDPGPLHFLKGGVGSAAVLDQAVGPRVARLLRADLHQSVGQSTQINALLERRAFTAPVPPPLTDHLIERMKEHLESGDTKPAARTDQAADLFGPRSWIGPFLRCITIFVPEFLPILDIPDITFGVTQDVDGNGVEEPIYSEGFFDVRWDAGYIPPVTLVADASAFATPTCGNQPPLGPCAEPEIVVVGDMPLRNPSGAGTFPFMDTASGYAVRPNRPHSTGQFAEVPAASVQATAPACHLLEFWGCNHRLANGTPASHYRINARVSTNGGGTFGPSAPIVDTWSNWRVVGSPPVLQYKPMSQLPGGWWEVLNPADQWIPGDHYLLQWHSPPNGLVELQLELGQLSGASVTPIGTAASVRLHVDNSEPRPQITALYWRLPGGALHTLPLNCPTIFRNHHDIEVVLDVQVAAAHLRSVELFGSGCGSGNPQLVSGFEALEGILTPTATYWHKTAADNVVSRQVVWSVPASLPPGAYGFGLTAWSRAFHPGDGHVYTPTNPDIAYNPGPIWTSAQTTIAIVD
jgi:hypothetical protein